MSTQATRIRQPRFADDMWYSANPVQLKNEVQKYLDNAPVTVEAKTLVGLVAPHAGYFFSGHVAGATFGVLHPGAFDTVILLGPDHRGATQEQVAVPNFETWRTPLGDVPVDWELLQIIQQELNLYLLPNDEEHSLEVEIPFLQQSLGRFQLVPLIMGNQSLNSCQNLSTALTKAIQKTDRHVLLVASSDLSHFFNDTLARRLDEQTLRFVLNMDAKGLIDHVQDAHFQGNSLACGSGPIATVMLTAQALSAATRPHLLKYATSADVYDVHPNRDRVVGYAAVAFSK